MAITKTAVLFYRNGSVKLTNCAIANTRYFTESVIPKMRPITDPSEPPEEIQVLVIEFLRCGETKDYVLFEEL